MHTDTLMPATQLAASLRARHRKEGRGKRYRRPSSGRSIGLLVAVRGLRCQHAQSPSMFSSGAMVVKRLLVDAVACARDAVVLTKARLVRIELCLLRKNIFRWPSLNHL